MGLYKKSSAPERHDHARRQGALCGHLTEFGRIVPQDASNAVRLIAIVWARDSGLPVDAISTLKVLIAAPAQLEAEIGKINAKIACRAKENEGPGG